MNRYDRLAVARHEEVRRAKAYQDRKNVEPADTFINFIMRNLWNSKLDILGEDDDRER